MLICLIHNCLHNSISNFHTQTCNLQAYCRCTQPKLVCIVIFVVVSVMIELEVL